MPDIVPTAMMPHIHTEQMPSMRDGEDTWQKLQLHEIHHRIRNCLNLICCTLQLQALRSANKEASRALSTAADRIQSFARVQGLLEGQAGRLRTELTPYITSLVRDLQVVLLDPVDGRDIRLIRADPVHVPEDELAPLGSIVAELVTNSVKYGAGNISVNLQRVDASLEISVEDEGSGFPPGFDFTLNGGLGLRLLRQLCMGMAGSLSIDRSVTHGKVIASVDLRQSRQLELSLSDPDA